MNKDELLLYKDEQLLLYNMASVDQQSATL